MIELGMSVPNEIRLVGGGSRNALWRKIIADVFQVKVCISQYSECAGAYGASIQSCAIFFNQHVGRFASQHALPLQTFEEDKDSSTNNVSDINLCYCFPTNCKQTIDIYQRQFQRHVQIGVAVFETPLV
jgi:ribulose kinase